MPLEYVLAGVAAAALIDLGIFTSSATGGEPWELMGRVMPLPSAEGRGYLSFSSFS